ncbi:MAG TPA: putative porin [Steroidobacter sp.]
MSVSLAAQAQSPAKQAYASSNEPSATTAEELALIRSQLQNILQRVDRLEAENERLKAENGELKRQTEQVSRELAQQSTQRAAQNSSQLMGQQQAAQSSLHAADAPRPAAKEPEWANRVTVKGDLRYRHQRTDDESAGATREEDLLRARLSVQAKVNDRMVATVGVATSSSPGNPRGANVQLDGAFSRKSLYLDLAYFDWSFADGAHLIGGKMKVPFERPGQSLFWDNDVNPEGLAVTYRAGSLFGSAWSFWVEENVQAGTATPTATRADTRMYGLQLGNRFDIGSNRLTVAASYYDLASAQGRRPFYNGAANGNSLTATGGLAYDFQVVGLMAEYSTRIGSVPLQVWGDFAKNLEARFDTAFAVGTVVGKASNPGSWETGLMYQILEKDALFAQHIDSDFGGGLSDADGWVLRMGYAPLQNWVLNATYFKTDNNRDVGAGYDFDRFMLDFNTRF